MKKKKKKTVICDEGCQTLQHVSVVTGRFPLWRRLNSWRVTNESNVCIVGKYKYICLSNRHSGILKSSASVVMFMSVTIKFPRFRTSQPVQSLLLLMYTVICFFWGRDWGMLHTQTHRHEFVSNFPSQFFKMTVQDILEVFGRFLVRVSVGTPDVLSDVYHDFPQSLQDSAGI